MKKIAIDCYYYNDYNCYSVGLIFNNWKDKHYSEIIDSDIKNVEHYIPGKFWRRELPGIMSILEKVDLEEFDTIILDGNCWLKDNNSIISEGLGMKVWNKIRNSYPDINVMGVAKTEFCKTSDISYKVMRGKAKSPLYITACKKAFEEESALNISNMFGKYRIPKLLKVLDDKTKEPFKNVKEYEMRKPKDKCRYINISQKMKVSNFKIK